MTEIYDGIRKKSPSSGRGVLEVACDELFPFMAWAIRFCLAHPQWQLSLQTHKVTGIR